MDDAYEAEGGGDSSEELAAAVRAGDRRALARTITLIESTRPDHRARASSILDRLSLHTGKSLRVGISGAPGVGKSTFIETLGMHLIKGGRQVAVLSVDPSSKLSGGSILGDKTRMAELGRHEAAFIRPSPAGTTLGGVARRTREALLACEAAGYDIVIVETVGVGQSETAVSEMTDLFILMLLPGSGDELQGLKRGIVELADVIVVNKADGALREAAERAVAAARSALSLARPRPGGWKVPVLPCSALEGTGIDTLWEHVLRFREALTDSGGLAARRADQARAWMWAETAESLLASLREHPAVQAGVRELESVVTAGKLFPPAAARRLLDLFIGGEEETVNPSAIGRLGHVAVVVPDLGKAAALYRDTLGAAVSEPQPLGEHGVTVVFVDLPNTRVELLQPLGEDSPVARFLEQNPAGGIHHLCFEVGDLASAAARLVDSGARILGDGKPKKGAHGTPVLFLHPKDTCGTLIELEETRP